MNIAVFGQTRWASLLAETLNSSPDEDCRAAFFEANAGLKPQTLTAVCNADVLMRVGFRPGARTPRGIAFDALWSVFRNLNRRAQAAYFWIGTDVWSTLNDVRSGKIIEARLRRTARDVHFAAAPWLVAELKEVGIESEHVLIDKLPEDVIAIEPPTVFPKPFTVLTYIPDSRPKFYGAASIYECARNLPCIRFEVVGGTGRWVQLPLPNLHFFGWQNMAEYLKRATVLVRMVEHDALGGTVQQALAAARHVIYSYPVPHALQVPFGDTARLTAIIRQLYKAETSEGLTPNLAGRKYALREFDVVPHYRKMLEILHQHSHRAKSYSGAESTGGAS
jgi:hypothetical protein